MIHRHSWLKCTAEAERVSDPLSTLALAHDEELAAVFRKMHFADYGNEAKDSLCCNPLSLFARCLFVELFDAGVSVLIPLLKACFNIFDIDMHHNHIGTEGLIYAVKAVLQDTRSGHFWGWVFFV